MSMTIFDEQQRQLRRERAARLNGDRFLHQRAFDDCLDRLSHIKRDFAAPLIVGSAGESWAAQLSDALSGAPVRVVEASDTGALCPGSFDLCLSIGELETSSDLTAATFTLRHLLGPGGLLLGSIVGGQSLPRLRAAMLAADRSKGAATPRIHPQIDGPSLSALLASVGLAEPVIDVDRVDVSYPSIDRLVADLRAMGCTNILTQRSRTMLSRSQLEVARSAFLSGEDRAIERFDLLNFAAWAPQ
ncbi:MAG: SAM-dependent methyltransferase [Sphingomicrobium sp.]